MAEVIGIRSKTRAGRFFGWSVADMLEYLSGKIRSGEMDARRAVVIIEVSPGVIESTQAGSKLRGDRHDRDLQGRNHRWCSGEQIERRGRRHMGRVAELGCVLCRHLGFDGTPAEVHHIRDGQGAAQRASDFLTVPLCPEHHRGGTGLMVLEPRLSAPTS